VRHSFFLSALSEVDSSFFFVFAWLQEKHEYETILCDWSQHVRDWQDSKRLDSKLQVNCHRQDMGAVTFQHWYILSGRNQRAPRENTFFDMSCVIRRVFQKKSWSKYQKQLTFTSMTLVSNVLVPSSLWSSNHQINRHRESVASKKREVVQLLFCFQMGIQKGYFRIPLIFNIASLTRALKGMGGFAASLSRRIYCSRGKHPHLLWVSTRDFI